MGDLTKNISRKELACKCGCGLDSADFATVSAIQHCCDRFSTATKKTITIKFNCFNRCRKHNDDLREEFKRTGGKSGEDTAVNSQHIYSRAADVKLFADGTQIPPKEVVQFFDENYPQFSTKAYSTFTHIDSRTGARARW